MCTQYRRSCVFVNTDRLRYTKDDCLQLKKYFPLQIPKWGVWMDCMKAQKLIRPYLEGQISDRELEEFLDHVENCPECHDDLEIYFSIYETLGDDSDDRNYDFKRKLAQKIAASRRYLSRRHAYRKIGRAHV